MNWPALKWFYQQSRRDQIALIICALCMSAALLWLAIIKPINTAASDSERRLQTSIATLARVQSLAANLQYFENQQNNRPRQQQISIVGVIDQSSRSAGLSFSSVNPSANGQEATVRFDNAELPAMLQWLYDLENSYQAQIEDLRLNGSTQAGYVSGSVRIRK
jgi:general secretion pathway protein M